MPVCFRISYQPSDFFLNPYPIQIYVFTHFIKYKKKFLLKLI